MSVSYRRGTYCRSKRILFVALYSYHSSRYLSNFKIMFRMVAFIFEFILLCREETFASADAAYVLAYSIIMLTTDLHSAQVSVRFIIEGENRFCG